jgi:hypothetical protein
LRFVNDEDYAGFDPDNPPTTTGLLDIKLATEDDELGEISRYPKRSDAFVLVPVPASFWLMALGLGVLGAARLRRRTHHA